MIASEEYPSKLAAEFLKTLAKNLYEADAEHMRKNPLTINSLDQGLKFNIYDLHLKYKNPFDHEDNNLNSAKSKINQVSSLMKSNISSMLNNQQNLNDIEKRSSSLAETASGFRNNAKQLQLETKRRKF